ncbi:MAG TPA: site-specific integrase [Verrucomicrobiae bacterium]|nr:site-specific integrase [Verrucomicrobiae bacterium]
MKRYATEGNTSNKQRQSHGQTFAKVLDGRKHPIRGLWCRNGRFYGRLNIENAAGVKETRRVPLTDKEGQPVQTVAQAVETLNRLKVNRTDNALPTLRRAPKFAAYVTTYMAWIRAGEASGQAMKKPATIIKEESHLKGWIEHLGGSRLDKIGLRHINAYIAKRLEAGLSKRTVKLDLVYLGNVLNHAHAEGLINVVPKLGREARKRLKSTPPRRPLFTPEHLEALCTAAMDTEEDGSPVTKNWLQFCDYIRLLAYCGAREQEALKLRWSDVDFEREQLTIGSDGDTKNKTGRVVDLNPKLKAHLGEMKKRKAPDSQWLFPSPQRGEKDIHARSFRESLKLVRAHAAAKYPHLARKAFHDLRHHFISMAVMAGLDYLTIASWVGHQDGGVLIGKVYGHLADSHKKEQAQKLTFQSPAKKEGL